MDLLVDFCQCVFCDFVDGCLPLDFDLMCWWFVACGFVFLWIFPKQSAAGIKASRHLSWQHSCRLMAPCVSCGTTPRKGIVLSWMR